MSKEKTNDKKYFYYNKKELKQLLKTLIEESEPLNSLYKELKDRENKLKQISKAQKKEWERLAIERRTLDEFCEKINIRKKELKKDRELIKKEIKNLIKVILKNLFKKKDKSID